MVPDIPLPIRDAIKKPGPNKRIAVLAYIDHPDGTQRLWSRIGKLNYDGFEWRGVGSLGRVTGIGGSKKVAVRPVTFELRGVPPETTTFLESNIRGRIARAWLAALHPRRNAINGELYLLAEGKCDTQTLSVDDSKKALIRILVNCPLFVVDRAQNLAWTTEWIRRQYGSNISGLDQIPTLVNATENWTKTAI